jgi:hypothetical protein
MKTLYIFLLLLVAAVEPAVAQTYKTIPGKMYLRTHMWTGMYGTSLDISWIFLNKDGLIIKNPKYGTNPVNIKAELETNAKNVGSYQLAGNKLLINWHDGRKAEWKVESKNGDYSAIDGGIVSAPKPMPTNYRLSGEYTASIFLPNVSSVNKLKFQKDGTFSEMSSGAISTNQVSEISRTERKGTYNISGNTLQLNFSSGEKTISNIAIWDDGTKKNLVINTKYFPQQ